ncbi:ferrous iron transport protein B [Schlesneria sp. DSM 10557]|uniref:ferrous iron transport protein B n=1 Tax=Schlesneria sp. DSM 10557 TaxID=3044399 RepID=UPI0035A185E3
MLDQAQTLTTERTVAVIGNPNTGKSTLFTALTGVHSRIGNYPGVTVEKKLGWFQHEGQSVRLVDLPGTYSLSPRTLDEMVSVDVLLGSQPDVGSLDAIVCIADASNLERNLYVVSQVLDLGLPTVLVLNMWDVATERGIQIDVAELERRLGITVVPCEAHKRKHIDAVRTAILRACDQKAATPPDLFPARFTQEAEQLQSDLQQHGVAQQPIYLIKRLLLDVGGQLETTLTRSNPEELLPRIKAARERLSAAGCRVPSVEAKLRYAWARQTLKGVMTVPEKRETTLTDTLDRWLTHKFWGLAIFCITMFVVFQSISTVAEPLMSLFEYGQTQVGDFIGSLLPHGPLRSLLVHGVVAGVGGILVFLPQICLLFLFIALLEDCGYMARAAFLMDKLMTKVGLSGKSFVPLMSSFACAIPGIMATRTIENRRDRMVTILIAPLMSCSARAPVYWLMIAAFFPPIAWANGWITLHGLMLFTMTFFGAIVAIPVAWLFKKTLFKGETPPFVMELPTYKWPSPVIVLHRVFERAAAFVMRAGTLILATTILIWSASYFPSDHSEEYRILGQIDQLESQFQAELEEQGALEESLETLQQTEATPDTTAQIAEIQQKIEAIESQLQPLQELKETHNAIAEELLASSYLGRLGKTIEPAVKPLGWDWKIGVGVLASFPAREVIISTLGTIYSLGSDVDENSQGLQTAVQSAKWPDGRPVYSIPVAISIMVFFALCAQCASTLLVIHRETNHWGWAVFTFVYMTSLAYVAAWIAFVVSSAILNSGTV